MSAEAVEVSMKVNPTNMVKSLKFGFTNKTTVLGELMQNARRAGAIKVEFDFDGASRTLTVTDDGCGIDSLETLLTVAESGWDADTMAQEHPFGIGFLSALFACEFIGVDSKSGVLSAPTEDILAFKPIAITPGSVWDGRTTITLTGVDRTLTEVTLTKGLTTLSRRLYQRHGEKRI